MKLLSSLVLITALTFCFTSCKNKADIEGESKTEKSIKANTNSKQSADLVNNKKTNQLSSANATSGEKLPVTTVTANQMVHDFGTVKEGVKPTTVFKLTNTGDIDMIINKAQASCGCTTPDAPLNKPFKPGETAEIKVQYDSNKRPGAINKSITIHGNFDKPLVLKITGNVTPAAS